MMLADVFKSSKRIFSFRFNISVLRWLDLWRLLIGSQECQPLPSTNCQNVSFVLLSMGWEKLTP